MITLKKTMVGAVVAFAAFFGLASSAQALTIAELNAYIAQGFTAEWIMANVGGSTSGSTGSTTCGTTYGYTATSTLRSGMKGAAVSSLQAALRTYGGATITVDGSFGPATANAVRAFQASKGLGADGIAGPATQGALQTASMTTGNCTTNPGTNPTGPISGGAGDAVITSTSVDVETEVREGSTQKVLGFRVEAQDSDIRIENLRVVLDNQNTASSHRDPSRFISEIQVLQNGQVVGSIDARDLSRDGNVYSRNISLNNAVVRKGASNRADFYITFKALSSIDSGYLGSNASFNLDVEAIRFVDGTGAIMTVGQSQEPSQTGIHFVDLAGSGDVEMRLSKGTNSPAEQSIQVNKTSTTNNVTLLEFRVKAEGTDMMIDEMDVTLDSNTAHLSKIFGNVKLMRGNSTLAEVTSFNNATSQTVSFDLFDEYEIEEGDTETFKVVAQLLKQDTNFSSGERVKASVVLNSITAEDQDGNNIPNGSKFGSANGDFQTLIVDGSFVTYVTAGHSTTEIGSTIEGTISLTFDVEAVGNEDIVINESGTATSGAVALGYSLAGTGVSGTPITTGGVVSSSNLTATGGNFTVAAGDTKRFTLSVKYTKVAGFAKLTLNTVDGLTVSNVATPNY